MTKQFKKLVSLFKDWLSTTYTVGEEESITVNSIEAQKTIEPSERSPVKTAAEREMDFLIKEKKTEKIIEYINNGYKMPDEQFVNLFSEGFFNLKLYKHQELLTYIENNHKEYIQKTFKTGITWSENEKVPNIEKLRKLLSKDSPETRAFITKKIKDTEMLGSILYPLRHLYETDLENYHNSQKTLEWLNDNLHYSNLGWRHGIDGTKNSNTLLHSTLLPAINYLLEAHKDCYDFVVQNQIKDLGEFIKTSGPTNTVQPLAQKLLNIRKTENNELESQLISNLEVFDIQNLPTQAQEQLQTILSSLVSIDNSKQYSKNNSQAQRMSEEKFILQSTINTNIPQVLNEYLALSPEKRSTLKTQEGKTVDILLFESLNKISVQLNNIVDSIENKQLNQLSATHKYLTAKK